MPYANNKGADQPALPRGLISTFVVHCLDSIIPLLAISKISISLLASEAEQAGLKSTLVENPEDRFSRDVARLISNNVFQDRILHEMSVVSSWFLCGKLLNTIGKHYRGCLLVYEKGDS